MVSTPSEFNDSVSGYVGGDLFDKKSRAQQRKVVEGGSSDPPGPVENAARLGILRYETECGTVWGYTGYYPGYTQFMAARFANEADARRSGSTALTTTIGGALRKF